MPLAVEEFEKRFGYHPADTEWKQQAHSKTRAECMNLADFLDGLLPDGREKALAITKLEEVMFWSNAALARNPDGTD